MQSILFGFMIGDNTIDVYKLGTGYGVMHYTSAGVVKNYWAYERDDAMSIAQCAFFELAAEYGVDIPDKDKPWQGFEPV